MVATKTIPSAARIQVFRYLMLVTALGMLLLLQNMQITSVATGVRGRASSLFVESDCDSSLRDGDYRNMYTGTSLNDDAAFNRTNNTHTTISGLPGLPSYPVKEEGGVIPNNNNSTEQHQPEKESPATGPSALSSRTGPPSETKANEHDATANTDSNVSLVQPTNITTSSTTDTGDEGAATHLDDRTHEKYLLYYTHSGFANQISALKRAAHLAYLTNRTLVLPPVLPHRHSEFQGWRGRYFRPSRWTLQQEESFSGGEASDSCRATRTWTRENQMLDIQDDIQQVLAVNGTSQFPSFLDLIDVSLISKLTGIHFIDFPDFVNQTHNNSRYDVSSWFSKNPNRTVDLDGFCTLGVKGGAQQMVEAFEETFGSDDAVFIGSAFALLRGLEQQRLTFQRHEAGTWQNVTFRQLFLSFPPSPQLLRLLQEIYALLPQDYIGVQMRFPDKGVECQDAAVIKAFQNVFQDLSSRNVKDNTTILIGSNWREAAECLFQNAKANDQNQTLMSSLRRQYNDVTTIQDLIQGNVPIDNLMKEFQIGPDTLALLLDQFFIGLAEHMVMDASTFGDTSTFQGMILDRHLHREEFLSQLDGK